MPRSPKNTALVYCVRSHTGKKGPGRTLHHVLSRVSDRMIAMLVNFDKGELRHSRAARRMQEIMNVFASRGGYG